jgi:hypothetical protein
VIVGWIAGELGAVITGLDVSPLDGHCVAFAAEMTAQFFEMLSACRT